MKFHPDRNPDDPEAEHKFKEARRPTRCSPIRRSARSTTSSVMPACEGGRGGGFSAGEAFGDIFGEMFGDIFSRRPARPLPGVPRRRPALRARAGSRAGGVRHRDRDPDSVARRVRDLQGHGGGQGLHAEDLRHLQRAGPGARAAIHLHHPAALPALQGPRQDHQQSLRYLLRPGAGAAGEDAAGVRAGGRRYGRPHPPERRGRGGPQRRPAGRPVRRDPRHASMRFSSARAAICPARCRSASPPRRSAATSRCRRWTARSSLKIPAETQSGRVFRVREKGVKPVRGGAPGDLFCRVVIETPVGLTARAEGDAARQFEASLHAGQPQAARAILLRRRQEVLHRARSSRSSTAMPGVAIFGITGRMGQALLRALREQRVPPARRWRRDDAGARADPPYLVGALASPGQPPAGRRCGRGRTTQRSAGHGRCWRRRCAVRRSPSISAGPPASPSMSPPAPPRGSRCWWAPPASMPRHAQRIAAAAAA